VADVHDVHIDVHDHDANFYDPHSYETVDYNDLIASLKDKVKPKELCFLCWDWHYSRSVEWGPERDHGHRFS
jgi:hypothetical protein